MPSKTNLILLSSFPLLQRLWKLLANSIKHAFSSKEGFITINLLKTEHDTFKIIYSDNGKWIEPNAEYTGFGLGLIQTLTEQLEGHFTRKGSEYTFTIKNLDD